jgi:four helix bundle protein
MVQWFYGSMVLWFYGSMARSFCGPATLQYLLPFPFPERNTPQNACGSARASSTGMLGVKRAEDLDAYKLAVELRKDVFRLTSRGTVSRDFKFVSQIRDAARGGPRNIAEGFSRFAPSEFHQFLSYAKASLDETRTHVEDGRESNYFNHEETERLLTFAKRALAAISGLMRYLESPAAKQAYEALRQARQHQAYVPKRSRQKP